MCETSASRLNNCLFVDLGGIFMSTGIVITHFGVTTLNKYACTYKTYMRPCYEYIHKNLNLDACVCVNEQIDGLKMFMHACTNIKNTFIGVCVCAYVYMCVHYRYVYICYVHVCMYVFL